MKKEQKTEGLSEQEMKQTNGGASMDNAQGGREDQSYAGSFSDGGRTPGEGYSGSNDPTGHEGNTGGTLTR